jgi:hypothetical protein
MHVFGNSGTSTRQPPRGWARVTFDDRNSASGAGSQRAQTVWLLTRAIGALALLAVGAVHLQQYFDLYSAIPTIGTLFVLNFVGATAMGLGLLAPTEHLLGRRGGAAVALLTLGGIGLAATAFVFLLVSEHTPLFGFMEPGYDPTAILASRIAEAVTVLLLGTYLAARFVMKVPPVRRW